MPEPYDYDLLKAKYDILLAVVKHYANIGTWTSEETGSWSPKVIYKSTNENTSGYDAAHKAFGVLKEMDEKRRDLKNFCEQKRKLYNDSVKHLYPDIK